MLEGIVSYFHQPTNIQHGCHPHPEDKSSLGDKNWIFKRLSVERSKTFQTHWFTRLSGFVSAFTEYFQYCPYWPGSVFLMSGFLDAKAILARTSVSEWNFQSGEKWNLVFGHISIGKWLGIIFWAMEAHF